MLRQALLTCASSAASLPSAFSPFSTHRAFLHHLQTVTVMQVLCHHHKSDFPADVVCLPGREGVCLGIGSVWVSSAAVFLPCYLAKVLPAGDISRSCPSPASLQTPPEQQRNSNKRCPWPVKNKAEGFLFRVSASPSAPDLQNT